VPAPVNETVKPETEHVPVAVRVTVKVDVAVGLRPVSGPGITWFAIDANVIVCGTLTTLNVLVARPAAYVVVSSDDALIVQVPAAIAVIFFVEVS
jgi:hypothetical protein